MWRCLTFCSRSQGRSGFERFNSRRPGSLLCVRHRTDTRAQQHLLAGAGNVSCRRELLMTFYAKAVNPWTWQDQFTFSQAVDVSAAGRVVYCAGQTSVDGDGKVLHAGDMGAQLAKAFDNLETVLAGS